MRSVLLNPGRFPAAVVGALAPSGVLRAAINLGNPILAARDSQTGEPVGVSIDLANALAGRLGVTAKWLVVDAAAEAVAAVSRDDADIGFFAVDPTRAAGIAYTAPYLLIEGCYAVRGESTMVSIDDVDRPGRRVVVGEGSAYDLYLSRKLGHASIERAPTSPAVVDQFLATRADVAAGVRQQLEADVRRIGLLRLLPEPFMMIRQALACPRSRGESAAQALAAFVEELKASGWVAKALERHRIDGARVADPSEESEATGPIPGRGRLSGTRSRR